MDRVDRRVEQRRLVDPEDLSTRPVVNGEAVGVDRSGQELGPAQIDADHAAGRHFAHDTPPQPWPTRSPPTPSTAPAPSSSTKGSGNGAREGLDDLRGGVPRPEDPNKRRLRDRFTFWRVLGYIGAFIVGWLLLSLLLFLISAQVQRQGVTDAAGGALKDSGFTLTSPNTILVLGSDARTKNSKEPGANKIGQPSRSDTIMLMRVGGGKSARLSIPRDTLVDIPGHGRDKINAAYAYGGPGLATKTVSQYLGIPINHLVEVNFENFPAFIDSLGGITYKGGCVISRINGGARNGGTRCACTGARTTSTASRRSPSPARARTSATRPRTTSRERAASRRSCPRSRAG